MVVPYVLPVPLCRIRYALNAYHRYICGIAVNAGRSEYDRGSSRCILDHVITPRPLLVFNAIRTVVSGQFRYRACELQ